MLDLFIIHVGSAEAEAAASPVMLSATTQMQSTLRNVIDCIASSLRLSYRADGSDSRRCID